MRTLPTILRLVSAIGLIVVAVVPAAVAQSSYDCVGNEWDAGISVSRDLAHEGDVLEYTVTVANSVPGACDVAEADLFFSLPDGRVVPLTSDASFLAGEPAVTFGPVEYTVAHADLGGVGVGVAVFGSGLLLDDPYAPSVTEVSASLTTRVVSPGIEVVKTADREIAMPGDTISYSFVITNVGDVDLTAVSVIDSLVPDVTVPSDCMNLAPQASCTAGVEYLVSGQDPSPLLNTVTVTYEDALGDGHSIVTASDGVEVSLNAPILVGSLDIEKTNDADGDGVFSEVENAPISEADVPFWLNITNSGSADVTIEEITDAYGSTVVGVCSALVGVVLAPAETASCTFTLVGYEAGEDGSVTNTISVTGSDGTGEPLEVNDTSTVVFPEPADPDEVPSPTTTLPTEVLDSVVTTTTTLPTEVLDSVVTTTTTTLPTQVLNTAVTTPPTVGAKVLAAQADLPQTGADSRESAATGLALVVGGVLLTIITKKVAAHRQD